MSRILHPVHNLNPPHQLVDQRVFDIEPGGSVRVPATSDYKMVLLREGRMNVVVEGKSELMPTREGDVLLVPRMQEYHYVPEISSSTARLHVIRMLWHSSYVTAGTQGPLLSAAARRIPACRKLVGMAGGLRVVPLFRDGNDKGGWISRLLTECLRGEPGRERMIGALLEEFQILLERHLTGTAVDAAAPPPDRAVYLAARAREILQERLDRHWNLHDLAWELRVSGEHLARMFRRATGTTVFGELARLRVERAREWLLTTELPVGEIGRRVGVPDPTLFGRLFRRNEGLSPRDFRDLHRSSMIFMPRKTCAPIAKRLS